MKTSDFKSMLNIQFFREGKIIFHDTPESREPEQAESLNPEEKAEQIKNHVTDIFQILEEFPKWTTQDDNEKIVHFPEQGIEETTYYLESLQKKNQYF